MKPVAIVGAGITGLTAAFKLHQRGIPVTLYESGDRVGGVIRTVQEEGYLAEWGPSAILETSPKISALISELGLDSLRCDAKPESKKNYIVRGGKVHRVPYSPISFLTTPLFSMAAKMRLAAEPFIPPADPAKEESLAEFVVRRIGQEFLDYAINPLVSGIYAGDPDRLSVRHAFPKLREVEQKYGSLIKGQIFGAKERKNREEISKQEANKVSFENGLQVFTGSLGQHLGNRIRLRSAVTGISQTKNGWQITTAEDRQEYSAILLAAPAHKLATMKTDPPLDMGVLGGIEHPPVSVIVLGFRREDVENPLDGYGFLVPKAEQLSILGTTFSCSVFPNRAPSGHVSLTSFVGGCRSPELAGRDSKELYERTLRDLKKLLGVRGQPTYRHHVYLPKAIPQYNLGYERYLNFMNDTETRNPGLFFAGNFRTGISLADSIVSGIKIAGRIVESLEVNSIQ